MPFTDEMPKFAVSPVMDINTPILTLSPPPFGWQAKTVNRLAVMIELRRMRFIMFLSNC